MTINLDYFIQYGKSPKFQLWLSELQSFANDYNMDDLATTFDLENATGYQLDYIGKLVGYERPTRFVDDTAVWGDSFWGSANWGGSGTPDLIYLGDPSYRLILQVYCSQLTNPVTLNNIYTTLVNAFGDVGFEVIAGGLEIIIKVPDSLTTTQKDILLSGIIVAPQGVDISYEIIT